MTKKFTEESAAPRWIIRCAFVLAFALIAAALLIGQNYENRTYSADSYTNAKEQIRLRLEVDRICSSIGDQKKQYGCDEITETLKDHVTLNDLAAQETVALATRGLLWTGVLQGAVSALTLAFLVWTVLITRDMRSQATRSTRAMSEALEATRIAQQAHVFGMAYANFEEIKNEEDERPPHVHHAETENGYFTYWAMIENAGQTPARNVKYTLTRDYGSRNDAYLKESREIGSLGAGETRKIFSYTDDTTGYVKISEFDRPRDLRIRIAVTYTDVFGLKHGPTISSCRLQFGVEAHGTFRVLTKEEVLGATSDVKKSVAGAIHWRLHDLRDVWMRVRQTTREERDEKRKKRKKPK